MLCEQCHEKEGTIREFQGLAPRPRLCAGCFALWKYLVGLSKQDKEKLNAWAKSQS